MNQGQKQLMSAGQGLSTAGLSGSADLAEQE